MSESATPRKNSRRTVIGVVKSDRMNKTIVVQCERMVQHPRFKKYVKRSTTYRAHDENNEAQAGDRVEISETRPMSKTKNFRLVRVVEKARIPGRTPQVNDLASSESPS